MKCIVNSNTQKTKKMNNTITLINKDNNEIQVSKEFFLIFINVYNELHYTDTFIIKDSKNIALEWITAIYNTQSSLDPSYSGTDEDNFERWFDRWYNFREK